MGLRDVLYAVYARRLAGQLDRTGAPPRRRHPRRQPAVGARRPGRRRRHGHRAGADKIAEFLGWCEEIGVEVVTLWLLSTDNLDRPATELTPLLGIIEDAGRRLAADRPLAGPPGRRARPAARRTPRGAQGRRATRTADVAGPARQRRGRLRRPAGDRRRGALAAARARDARARRIEELAEVLDVEHIAEHLYTKGQPDPDLVIRTSGEQRLSGFLLWQSAHSEFYFCEAYWPDFRKVDFLRAIRAYARPRSRRLRRLSRAVVVRRVTRARVPAVNARVSGVAGAVPGVYRPEAADGIRAGTLGRPTPC